MNLQQNKIFLPGLQTTIHYQKLCHPAESGVPILMLHGWLDNSASMVPLLQASKRHVEIYALDLPGHGRSSSLAGHGGAQIIEYLYALEEFLYELNLDRVVLVGHSLGAIIASCFAASLPEKIESLVMFDALGPMLRPEENLAERMALRVKQRRSVITQQQPAVFTREDARRRWAAATGIAEEHLVELVDRNLRPVGDLVTWSYDPCLRLPSVYSYTENHILHLLKGIKCPALLVAAEGGLMAKSEPALQARIEAIDHLQFYQVPGGHHVHLEQPERCAALLDQFLDHSPVK